MMTKNEEISGEISFDPDLNKRIVQTSIAKQFLRVHGDMAYMMVLMEMESDIPERRKTNWREILTIIEQLEKEQKDASN
jgi:hypothetical protein